MNRLLVGKGNPLSIRGFVLGVVLLALVGLCILQESFKQTQARYRLAELDRHENELKKKLDQLRTREGELRSPMRLRALAHEKCPDFIALGSVTPQPMAQSQKRRPGEVLDEPRREPAREDVDMASVQQW